MATTVTFRWFLAGLVGAATIGAIAGAPPCASASTAMSPFLQDAKAELEKKLAAIDKKDANALFQVAQWAEQNALKTDSKRLLRDVIKINPDHAEARGLLGYEKFGEKWLTKREIDRERAKAEESSMAEKGLKKWKDSWVPQADYEKLEKGLVKYEGNGEVKWVSPEQKERLEKGMTLVDGVWLAKENLEHHRAGEFDVGGKWLKEDEANKVHGDFTNPWVLESQYCALTTTCTYAFAKKVLTNADGAIKRTYEIMGLPEPVAADYEKVGLIMVKDNADYSQLGNQPTDTTDADMSTIWSSFILTDANTSRFAGVTIYEVLQPGNDTGNDDFSLGHCRFAVAAATIRNMTFVEPPSPWFSFGVASYMERYWAPGYSAKKIKPLAKWTLDTLMKEGGTTDLKTYFDPFKATRQTLLQGGAIIGFLIEGQKSKKVEDQWNKVLESFKKPKDKGLLKDFLKLETVLGKDGGKDFDAYVASIQS
ncbi:MAG: hypothetical protein EXS13_07775 [Planctomycetes bacterium]|nr:hypothetical protein [Planctomycetota bacterium]